MTQSKDDSFTIDISDLKLDDFVNNTGDSNTITIDMNNYSMSDYTVDTVDISSITTSTIDTTWDSLTNITFDRVMFEDDMPDPQEIKLMCEEYPALEKVYENFKTIYKMVEQDWKGKKDDDEELPF